MSALISQYMGLGLECMFLSLPLTLPLIGGMPAKRSPRRTR